MRISEAFQEYIEEEIIGVGGSLNTCEAYKYAMKAFIGEWGNINIEDIDVLMVKRFCIAFQTNAKTKQRVHSIGTVRNYVCCLTAVIGMCKTNGFQVLNPRKIRIPKREKKIPFCLDEPEIEELIEVAGRPNRGYPSTNRFRNVLIIKMLYCTGLRISELCKLNYTDIRNREFVVVGKSKYPRPCFITKEVEQMIDTYLKMRNDSNPALFVSNQTGGSRISPKTVQAMFRRVRSELAVGPATPHTMRHSFCTHLLDRRVDIRHTAEMMGHQSWNTTKIYTTIKNRTLRDEYERAMC